MESDTFYFLCHPCGDRTKITVVDLGHNVSYQKNDWDVVNSNEFDNAKDAIMYGKRLAIKYRLEYQPFESRYGEEVEDGLYL